MYRINGGRCRPRRERSLTGNSGSSVGQGALPIQPVAPSSRPGTRRVYGQCSKRSNAHTIWRCGIPPTSPHSAMWRKRSGSIGIVSALTEVENELQEGFAVRRSMNANAFPSLIYKTDAERFVWLTKGYADVDLVLQRLKESIEIAV